MSTHTRIFSCLLCGIALAWASLGADSPEANAGDTYLKAYQLKNEGKELEQAGKPEAALAKYAESLKIMEEIVKDYPKWQPDILAFRIQWLKNKIDQIKHGRAPTVVPSLPAPKAAPFVIPSLPSDPTALEPGLYVTGVPRMLVLIPRLGDNGRLYDKIPKPENPTKESEYSTLTGPNDLTFKRLDATVPAASPR